jgi:hypothetical protein
MDSSLAFELLPVSMAFFGSLCRPPSCVPDSHLGWLYIPTPSMINWLIWLCPYSGPDCLSCPGSRLLAPHPRATLWVGPELFTSSHFIDTAHLPRLWLLYQHLCPVNVQTPFSGCSFPFVSVCSSQHCFSEVFWLGPRQHPFLHF